MDDTQRRARTNRTVDRLLERIMAHDMPGFAAEWAPDGTMEFPFAGPGSPSRLAGRDAVAGYVAGYNDVVLPRTVVSERRHDTTDPDTLVLEFEVDGTTVATGADYRLGYVCVITVSDEGVTSYRDYWSPAATAEVFGGAHWPGHTS